MAKILVIDDEQNFRETLVETIKDIGFEAVGAQSVREALALLSSQTFNAIFIDFRMPDMNGLTAIKRIQEILGTQSPPIVMITAFFDSQNTIEAMKLGAFDHLTKPIGRKDIESTLHSIFKAFPTNGETTRPETKTLSREMLIGNSEAMRTVLKLIGRLSAGSTSVLITGETGTGKELVAKAIHENSPRAGHSFVAINCAAIPENLLESELFGHVKGAFTGAIGDRKGSFQLSEGGTLFLDEIGDMNLTLQAKILRALQEREVTPVGSSKAIKFDARIIAATHRDLQKQVAQKAFREDLFFRLNVVEICLPPLRERGDDIEELATYFLGQSEIGPKNLSDEAKLKLKNYRWPGNVRELKNVVERATVVAPGQTINDEDIRFLYSSEDQTNEALDLPQAIARLEKQLIQDALKNTDGNRSEAARRLGIQRQLLYSKIKEHRIDL